MGVTFLLSAALTTAWFALPIKRVEVSGNTRLSSQEVRRLAGLDRPFGWLYYGAWRARGLLDNPWVQEAHIVRQFPDQVQIELLERQPFVRFQPLDREMVAVTEDGRELPLTEDAKSLPLISGWGPERLDDALLIVRAFSRYTVRSVQYTPSGLTVETETARVWSGDLNSLMKYAGSISMYPHRSIHIYPWGVSVQ